MGIVVIISTTGIRNSEIFEKVRQLPQDSSLTHEVSEESFQVYALDASSLAEKVALVSHFWAATTPSYVHSSATKSRFAGQAGQHDLK